jgi:hypothetical protein
VFDNNLANEGHIVKKSKTCHYNIASREQKMDEKLDRLAKQIVDIAGGKASKLLQRQNSWERGSQS